MDDPPDRQALNPLLGRGRREAAFSPEAIHRVLSPTVLAGSVLRLPEGDRLDYGHRRSGALERVWQGDRNRSGWSCSPDALEPDQPIAEYVFPPALPDACLQAVIPADSDFDQRNGGLYLPHEIEAVRLFPRPGHRVWVHARLLLEKTPSTVHIGRRHLQRGWPAGGTGGRLTQPSRRGRPQGIDRRPASTYRVALPIRD